MRTMESSRRSEVGLPRRMWRVGALPATDGPQLPVPGERRTVPLYLVAPEAQRGLRARVRFFRWLLASLVTLTTAIWGAGVLGVTRFRLCWPTSRQSPSSSRWRLGPWPTPCARARGRIRPTSIGGESMSVRLLAIALANLGVLLVAVRALLNATRQRRDARRCLDARRARHPDVGVNELALLEPEEIDVLTVAPSRATVRGTRILDPWSAELPIADHQLPVYANKLRNRARTGDVAAEVAIVVASAFAGVAASDIVRDLADGGQVHQAPPDPAHARCRRCDCCSPRQDGHRRGGLEVCREPVPGVNHCHESSEAGSAPLCCGFTGGERRSTAVPTWLDEAFPRSARATHREANAHGRRWSPPVDGRSTRSRTWSPTLRVRTPRSLRVAPSRLRTPREASTAGG